MSGDSILFGTASSSFSPSLLMLTMASISLTSPSIVPPVLSASLSVPPPITTNSSSATPTASASSVSSSTTTYGYVNGTGSSLPINTSVISDSSTQSTSSLSAGATVTAATSGDSNASTYLSSSPEASASSIQTSTTNESAQSPSAAPVSLMTSANRNASEPLYTSTGTPTQPGGALATHSSPGTTSSSNSFSNNRSAVTGTFVAVAIFSTAIFACLCVAWKRWLRRRARDRTLKVTTMSGDNADRGPYNQPSMSMINDGTVPFSTSTYRNDTLHHGIGTGTMLTANTPVPAANNASNGTGLRYGDPFSDYFAFDRTSRSLTEAVAIANTRTDSPVPSLASSTPSIYPPSLPPMEKDNDAVKSMVYPTSFSTPSINPPPRPPRLVRPPPTPFRVLAESAAAPYDPVTTAPFVTVVPPSTSPYTINSSSPLNPVEHSRYKLSKLLKLQLPTPPSSMSGHAQTDSTQCMTTSAAPVPHHSTDVHFEGTGSLV